MYLNDCIMFFYYETTLPTFNIYVISLLSADEVIDLVLDTILPSVPTINCDLVIRLF